MTIEIPGTEILGRMFALLFFGITKITEIDVFDGTGGWTRGRKMPFTTHNFRFSMSMNSAESPWSLTAL
jgi:hypothetical protein